MCGKGTFSQIRSHILVCLYEYALCDCFIRVITVLEYLKPRIYQGQYSLFSSRLGHRVSIHRLFRGMISVLNSY